MPDVSSDPDFPSPRSVVSLTAMTGTGRVTIRRHGDMVVLRYTAFMPILGSVLAGLFLAGMFGYVTYLFRFSVKVTPGVLATPVVAGMIGFAWVAVLVWSSDRLELEPASGMICIRRRRYKSDRLKWEIDYVVDYSELHRGDCTVAIAPASYPVRIGSRESDFLTRALGWRGFAVCLVHKFAPVFVYGLCRSRAQAELDAQEFAGLMGVTMEREDLMPISVKPLM